MLNNYLAATKLHAHRAAENALFLKDLKLVPASFDDREIIKTIDAFIFRFIKLQDSMGAKLFPALLDEMGDYKDNMSLLDVLDKLEKLEIIKNSDDWLDYRQIRNKLAHEYPDNKTTIIAGIQEALVYFEQMQQVINRIEQYISTHKSLK